MVYKTNYVADMLLCLNLNPYPRVPLPEALSIDSLRFPDWQADR